jgi:hypothetical protein
LETSWGTILGLSLDFGIWIRDAGWSYFGGTYRILITLRFRVRYGREIRRKPKEQNPGMDSKEEVFSATGLHLASILKSLF